MFYADSEKKNFFDSLKKLTPTPKAMIVVYSSTGPVDVNGILDGSMNKFILANVESKYEVMFTFPVQKQQMIKFLDVHCAKLLSSHDNWVFILTTELENKQEIIDKLKDGSFHTKIDFVLNGSKTMEAYSRDLELNEGAIIKRETSQGMKNGNL